METNRAEAKADWKHMQEMIKISQERTVAKIDASIKVDQEHMKRLRGR
jgi:hypothetical protein